MSEDGPITRKEKKSQRDAERRKGNKKRKRSEVDEDVNEAGGEAVEPQIEGLSVETTAPASSISTKVPGKKVSKKSTSAETDGKAKTQPTRPVKKPRTNDAQPASNDDDAQGKGATTEKATKSRFIVFIGNLPYNTTDTALQAHFKALQPFTLRHRTDKATKKSKGFAFLEFENYDRMKTCLKLYHHTMFDPDAKENGGTGRGNGKGGRKINVELTSGGGGNTVGRKEKIKERNVRLEEQRKRRAQAEKKAKDKSDKEKGDGGGGGKEMETEGDAESQGIHPARLARINQR